MFIIFLYVQPNRGSMYKTTYGKTLNKYQIMVSKQEITTANPLVAKLPLKRWINKIVVASSLYLMEVLTSLYYKAKLDIKLYTYI